MSTTADFAATTPWRGVLGKPDLFPTDLSLIAQSNATEGQAPLWDNTRKAWRPGNAAGPTGPTGPTGPAGPCGPWIAQETVDSLSLQAVPAATMCGVPSFATHAVIEPASFVAAYASAAPRPPATAKPATMAAIFLLVILLPSLDPER